MKIFVTGDNHIGKSYSSHPEKEKITLERINAVSKMAEAANNEGCGLFAVTGDLFDSVNVGEKTAVAPIVNALSKFSGTVAVIPGNHDYYDESSKVWKLFAEQKKKYTNIVLLNEYKPYEFDIGDEKAVIYPAFCDKKHSEPGENKLGWIKKENIPNDEAVRIGMAHGTVEGMSPDKNDEYFVMRRDELYNIPVDAWLIGHAHTVFPGSLTEKFTETGERIFNAGTHVQTDVNNNTEGICFILEIEKGKKIKARKYVSGDLRFYRKEIKLTAGNMKNELAEAVKDLGNNSVVDLILSGAVSDDEYKDWETTVKNTGKRFLEFTYNGNNLARLITKELVKNEFPEDSLSAKLLLNLLDNPKEAQLAYDLISEIKEDK